jgi:hypothetical protein
VGWIEAANFVELRLAEVQLRGIHLLRTPVNRALGGFVCVPGPRFGSPFNGYTRGALQAMLDKEIT